ncbi:unnamed protein product [Mytilus edulis]|uniref:Uncharacterized protein n=1 Tax=Mytilus edulis TaxID=6550 RepID=A0A8S3QTH9_MYTED|nr:unnamed protein product [Mytilus edulis]
METGVRPMESDVKRCTYTHKKDTHEHKKTNEHKRIEKRVKTSKNRRIETSEYTNKCVRIKTSKHGYIKTDERANKHKRIAKGSIDIPTNANLYKQTITYTLRQHELYSSTNADMKIQVCGATNTDACRDWCMDHQSHLKQDKRTDKPNTYQFTVRMKAFERKTHRNIYVQLHNATNIDVRRKLFKSHDRFTH